MIQRILFPLGCGIVCCATLAQTPVFRSGDQVFAPDARLVFSAEQADPGNNHDELDDKDDEEAFEGEDFLFRLEEAYTSEAGELEVSFTFGFLEGQETEREFEFEDGGREIERETSRGRTYDYLVEIEYGLTDRFQIELEIPYTSIREHGPDGLEKAAALGDLELGFGYALIQESETLPAVTAVFEMTLPTGDYRQGIGTDRVGFGGALAVSRDFGPWVGHLNFGYEYVNDARLRFSNRSDGPKRDLSGFEYGVGAAFKFSEALHGILELAGETEQELELDGRRWETELVIIPGLRYGFETESLGSFEFGVGFPIGLTSDSDDWGVYAKVQWEIDP